MGKKSELLLLESTAQHCRDWALFALYLETPLVMGSVFCASRLCFYLVGLVFFFGGSLDYILLELRIYQLVC